MMLKPFVVVLPLLAAFCSFTRAADNPPAAAPALPAGGQVLITEDAAYRDGGAFKTVAVDGPGFAKAVEVDVQKPGSTPWEVQLAANANGPIKKGDLCHIRFWARNLYSMTGSASLPVVFEMNEPPFDKSLELPITVGTAWQVVDLPFVAARDYAAGKSQLGIRLAAARQKVQIGGLRVTDYGTSVKYADLPRMRFDYEGRAADAPWRKAANERIERLRKSDMKIVIKDAVGNPVRDAQVSAVLQKHEFGFGTAISMRLLENTKNGEMYREKVKELFSTAVIENELKWPNIEWHKYVNSDKLVKWLNDNGIPTRGHCLVWPSETWLPKRIVDMPNAEMDAAIKGHITQTVSRYKGQLLDWDVINEPFANHLAMDRLGKQVMVEWFKAAHAADPNVNLFINDYEILASGGNTDTGHQQHYYDTIKYLKDNGAPIAGIGMQGHFGASVTSPENLLKILDRYASLGLRIKVTELDLNIDDEDLRCAYMRDFHIALFSHPAVDGILQWGFWEGSHWIPKAAMFNLDWTIRPVGQTWMDLVHGEWKTKAAGQTDAAGTYGFRGFNGTYQITVTRDGKTQTFDAKLSKGGADVALTLQ